MNHIALYEFQVIQKKKNCVGVKPKAVTCISSFHFANLKSFLKLKRDGSAF
jgi:hypothetical protein